MPSINIAIVGVGNCASSLVQGLSHYRPGANHTIGLMHGDVGGYRPSDIKVVAAWDVDRRKVGKDVAEAIFAKPNCTEIFCDDVSASGAIVRMGRKLDGIADHMADYPDDRTFMLADEAQPDQDDVVRVLKDTRADILVNYLPVGSQEASEFYAECALEAGVAFVNCIPVFIASDPDWAQRFRERGVPIIGDDIKAQLGATIVHRVLTDLFAKRGVRIERTYQLNTGGNTDFLNMLNRSRLAVQEGEQDRGGAGRGRAPSRRRQHPCRPVRLCRLAERQQDLFPAHGRFDVRRSPDEPGTAAVGRRLPEQRWCFDRHDPLRQACARSRSGRPDRRAGGLFLQASAPANDGRPRRPRSRRFHPRVR